MERLIPQKSYIIYKFQKFLQVRKMTTSKILERRKSTFTFFKVFYILNMTFTFFKRSLNVKGEKLKLDVAKIRTS